VPLSCGFFSPAADVRIAQAAIASALRLCWVSTKMDAFVRWGSGAGWPSELLANHRYLLRGAREPSPTAGVPQAALPSRVLGRLALPRCFAARCLPRRRPRESPLPLLVVDRQYRSLVDQDFAGSLAPRRSRGRARLRNYSDPHGLWPPRRMRIGHARPSSAFLGA
jgi:hypothetical protein